MEFNPFLKALHFSRFFLGVCGLLLVLNLVFYVFFIRDQRERIEDLQSAYMEKRKLRRANEGDHLKAYLQSSKALQEFKRRLPPKSAFAEKVGELNRLLDGSGLSVGKVAFQPEETHILNLWRYSTTFTVRGPYPAIKRLLADIQNSKSLYCIEGLSLSNGSEGKREVQMKLKLSTYFR